MLWARACDGAAAMSAWLCCHAVSGLCDRARGSFAVYQIVTRSAAPSCGSNRSALTPRSLKTPRPCKAPAARSERTGDGHIHKGDRHIHKEGRPLRLRARLQFAARGTRCAGRTPASFPRSRVLLDVLLAGIPAEQQPLELGGR